MKNLRIRIKLMLMVFVPLLAVLLVSLQGIWKINSTYRILTDYEKLYKVNELILNVDTDLYQILIAQNALVKENISDSNKTKNRQSLKENINQIEDRKKKAMDILLTIKQLLAEVKHNEVNKNIFELYDEFEKNYQVWLSSFNIETGEVKNQEQFEKDFANTRESIHLMTKIMEFKAAEIQTDMKATIYNTKIEFALLVFFVVLITLILGVIISKDLLTVVFKIKDLATRLSNYDFSEDLILKRSDEYGQTADTLNKAQKNVRKLINNIAEKTKNIDSSSKNLDFSINEISKKLNEVNESTKKINIGIQENTSISEEISASVEEIDFNINILSAKAMDGTNNAINIKERANSVVISNKQEIETIKKVYLEKESIIVRSIEEGKVVSEIGAMANTVSLISKQINLLSINAAIEAARAGEHGSGFAVVAEEVKKLAEQSSEAVKNVEALIEKVQKSFNDLSMSSNELFKFMDEDINKQLRKFSNIGNQYYKDAEFVNSMSSELAAMTEEINATIGQASKVVQCMAEMSQKSSESTNDIEQSLSNSTSSINKISETVKEQSKLANNLNEMVKKFKV